MNKECWPPYLNERRGEYELSSEKERIQFDWLHQQLKHQYWCEGLPTSILQAAIEHSWCVSVFHQHQQVGFARLISDYATFAYLADVYVAPEHRRQGLAHWMISSFTESSELPHLQKWLLLTASAQKVYEKSGFKPIAYPNAFMEIRGVSNYL